MVRVNAFSSKGELYAHLCGERNAYGRAGAEEITQSTCGNAQLVQAGDGFRLCAGGVEAKRGSVGRIVHGRRQRRDIRHVVIAWIQPVENIEKLEKRPKSGALAKNNVTADAQIYLTKRRTAELIERCLHAIYDRTVVRHSVAVDIEWSRHGVRASTLELPQGGRLEFPRKLHDPHQYEAMADVFSRRTVISRPEGIVNVRNAVDVIEQLTDGGAPGGRMRKNVIDRQFEAVGEAVLHLHGPPVVDGAVITTKKGKTRILVAPILMNSLLMLVTKAQTPIVSESVLVGCAGHERVRGVVVWVDQRWRARAVSEIECVDRGERVHPPVLRQIVVIHSDSRAQDGGGGSMRSERNA